MLSGLPKEGEMMMIEGTKEASRVSRSFGFATSRKVALDPRSLLRVAIMPIRTMVFCSATAILRDCCGICWLFGEFGFVFHFEEGRDEEVILDIAVALEVGLEVEDVV